MTKKISALICLTVVLCSITVSVINAESLTMSDRHNYFFEMQKNFSQMTTLDELSRAFDSMLINKDVYQDKVFENYYEAYRYVQLFHAGWTAINQEDYNVAYSNFDDLRLLKWPGDNAESITVFVDAYRKFAKGMYLLREGSTIQSLSTFESIPLSGVPLAAVQDDMRTQMRYCAGLIQKDAKAWLAKADQEPEVSHYKQALELFTALQAGEYFLDTEKHIAYCEKRVAELENNTEQSAAVLNDLTLTESSLTSLKLKWACSREDVSFLVTFAPEGISNQTQTLRTEANTIVLDDLIPATSYVVTISLPDESSGEITGSFFTANPAYYPQTEIMSIKLMSYQTDMERQSGLQTVVDAGWLSPVENNVVTLPRFDIANGDEGYILLLFYTTPVSDASIPVTARAILRTPDSGSYQQIIQDAVDGSKPATSLYIPVNPMLDSLYQEQGGWKETEAVIEILINDMFFGKIVCPLKP